MRMNLGQDYEYEMLGGKSYMKYVYTSTINCKVQWLPGLAKSHRLRYEYNKTAEELKKGGRDG